MSAIDGRVPVIVVGSGLTGLGMLRCLVQAGIPAYVACPPDDLVTRSRWYRPVPGVDWDGSVGPPALAVLAATSLPRAVLIPGRDNVALWLADLAQTGLAERFAVSSSPRHSLQRLQDKSMFAEYLRGSAMPHPRTFPVASAADIAAIPFGQLDRVFVKPADSLQFHEAFGTKGLWATDRAQLETIWSRLDQQGFKLIVQEYVPGRASDHYFLDGFRDRAGAFTGLFARRRRRIYPPDFGNSSYCESVPLDELGEAVPRLQALLADLAYRGIFSAEFKRDARDGQLRILEVNTRAWWYVEFAARCGVNVCRMAYEDAQSLPVGPAPRAYPVRAGCVNLEADIRAVFASGPRRTEPLHRTLRSWLRAYFHAFRWDDPGPVLWVLWSRVRQRMARTRTRPGAIGAASGSRAPS